MNLSFLFQLIQVLQSRKNNLLARLLNLACEKDFIQDGVDLYGERGVSCNIPYQPATHERGLRHNTPCRN